MRDELPETPVAGGGCHQFYFQHIQPLRASQSEGIVPTNRQGDVGMVLDNLLASLLHGYLHLMHQKSEGFQEIH